MIRRDAHFSKKCTSFKLQNDGSRDGEHAGTLYAQAIPTRSKCRSNGLPTHSPQFRSLLKQKNRKPSPVHGRARQRRARVRAKKNQYYIYDVQCAFGVLFYAKKARKICILPRQDIRFASFSQNRITLDTCRNFASASNPALKQRKGGKKATATACLAIAVGSNFNAKNFDFERFPSTPRRARQRLRRRA